MHISRLVLGVAALVLLSPGAARAQSDDGSVRLIGHDQVQAAFAKGMPLVEVGDYKIHASRREGPGMVEIHTRDTDIAYVLQGSATLVTGGTAVAVKDIGPEELRGTAIQGGETRQLQVGDVVVIPNGVPHWFKEVQAPFLYYVVKVRQAGRETAKGAM
ncbi:MAG TPA: cupin domain-containing protein [Gemmatimonadales bacterium]|nr:cupin domain-containing protein [Gemmatimonadales bacterium]